MIRPEKRHEPWIIRRWRQLTCWVYRIRVDFFFRPARVFPRVCKAVSIGCHIIIIVSFSNGGSSAARHRDSNEVILVFSSLSPGVVSARARAFPLLFGRPPATLHGRGLSGGLTREVLSRKSRTWPRTAEVREAARARPCGDSAMTEALSVSLRLPSGAVAWRSFVAPVVGFSSSLFSCYFIISLFPSLYISSLGATYRTRHKVGDGGFLARACDVKTIVRNAHRACFASFLWKETRSIQVRPLKPPIVSRAGSSRPSP